jgi:hypothetical protein
VRGARCHHHPALQRSPQAARGSAHLAENRTQPPVSPVRCAAMRTARLTRQGTGRWLPTSFGRPPPRTSGAKWSRQQISDTPGWVFPDDPARRRHPRPSSKASTRSILSCQATRDLPFQRTAPAPTRPTGRPAPLLASQRPGCRASMSGHRCNLPPARRPGPLCSLLRCRHAVRPTLLSPREVRCLVTRQALSRVSGQCRITPVSDPG